MNLAHFHSSRRPELADIVQLQWLLMRQAEAMLRYMTLGHCLLASACRAGWWIWHQQRLQGPACMRGTYIYFCNTAKCAVWDGANVWQYKCAHVSDSECERICMLRIANVENSLSLSLEGHVQLGRKRQSHVVFQSSWESGPCLCSHPGIIIFLAVCNLIGDKAILEASDCLLEVLLPC